MAKKKTPKMQQLPSLKAWAERMGVDIHIATAYQKARRNWQNRVSAFARKYGGVKSNEIPADIRTMSKMYGMDFEQYIEYRTSEIMYRSAHATEYLLKRQDTYISNIMDRMAHSSQFEGDSIVKEMNLWFSKATPQQKSEFIGELGGAELEYLGYVEQVLPQTGRKRKARKVRVDVVEYDFAPVIDAYRKIRGQ